MQNVSKLLIAGTGAISGAILIAGCVVREERPRRVYVAPAVVAPAPAPVVVEEAPPPGYVEVDVGPAPGPEYVIVGSHWEWRDGHRVWIHRYWRHR